MSHFAQYEFRSNYWDHTPSREAFMRFLAQIHGLDLGLWEAGGYWDEAYRPYSLFHQGEVIASVCVYQMNAVVEGTLCQLGQLSGVGTLPEYRRLGLNQQLTEHALAEIGPELSGVFLFADVEARGYYERTGFIEKDECLHTMPFPEIKPISGKQALDMTSVEHQIRLFELVQKRSMISRRLAFNQPKLVMFHALYTMPNRIWELPDLDCVVLADIQNDALHIYDIIASQLPDLEEILPYFGAPAANRVVFHFHTDRFDTSTEVISDPGGSLFVNQVWSLDRPVFPFTAKA